jgi:hypothetical protein
MVTAPQAVQFLVTPLFCYHPLSRMRLTAILEWFDTPAVPFSPQRFQNS